MGQTIISMNLNINDNEDQYNNFKKEKDQLLVKLYYINQLLLGLSPVNLYDLKTKRERLIERVNNMNIKIKKWTDYNIPKRETNIPKLPDLV